MKRALVTGASGFLGASVARVLLDRGREVRLLVRESSVRRARPAARDRQPERADRALGSQADADRQDHPRLRARPNARLRRDGVERGSRPRCRDRSRARGRARPRRGALHPRQPQHEPRGDPGDARGAHRQGRATLVADRVTRKPPAIPIDAVRMAKFNMFFSPAKAIAELGLPQTPVERAFEAALEWFSVNGYLDIDGGRAWRSR